MTLHPGEPPTGRGATGHEAVDLADCGQGVGLRPVTSEGDDEVGPHPRPVALQVDEHVADEMLDAVVGRVVPPRLGDDGVNAFGHATGCARHGVVDEQVAQVVEAALVGRRLRALEAVVARLQAELLAPLAAAERRQLVGLLRRLVAHQGTT
jgi:hypothetical protein